MMRKTNLVKAKEIVTAPIRGEFRTPLLGIRVPRWGGWGPPPEPLPTYKITDHIVGGENYIISEDGYSIIRTISPCVDLYARTFTEAGTSNTFFRAKDIKMTFDFKYDVGLRHYPLVIWLDSAGNIRLDELAQHLDEFLINSPTGNEYGASYYTWTQPKGYVGETFLDVGGWPLGVSIPPWTRNKRIGTLGSILVQWSPR